MIVPTTRKQLNLDCLDHAECLQTHGKASYASVGERTMQYSLLAFPVRVQLMERSISDVPYGTFSIIRKK
jgi:hypothetical protein